MALYFQGYLRKYKIAWWAKYNYILASALTSAVYVTFLPKCAEKTSHKLTLNFSRPSTRSSIFGVIWYVYLNSMICKTYS